MIRPRRLRPGARVSLVAPAGPLAPGAVERAVARVESLGWEPFVGKHARLRRGYLAGTDAERLEDLVEALESPDNDAIWCLRGGYGTMRLLPALSLESLRRRPRPLIGFSDNTALHLACLQAGLVTFHGPHAAAQEFPDAALQAFRAVLEDAAPAGTLPAFPDMVSGPVTIVPGTAEGPLVGGNLSLIAATMGTPYQLKARGSILFLEEVGEPLYRLDRLLTQLRLGGVFESVAGVAVGAVTECPEEAADPVAPLQVFRDRLGDLGVPVAYGLPFGHIPASWTLPLGVWARLDAVAGTLELLEPAVRG